MDDGRLSRAKSFDMDRLIDLLQIGGLKRAGRELIGPCPRCGGNDRFSVNTAKNLFQCRRCEGKGDQLGLVMFVLGYEFKAALEWLVGPSQELSAKERAEIDERDRKNRERKAKAEADFRARAIAEARAIWQSCRPAEDTPVRDYLAARGITRALLPRLPRALRFHPALSYMVQGEGGQWIEAHKGPAMVAAIQHANGQARAVHRTWFDVAAPLGKITIRHPLTQEPQARKKTWGAKKGGSIRLTEHAAPVLVMGEGIETTLSAMVAGSFDGAMFWAGVDLGNMSGQRRSGKGLRYAGIPDLDDDEAFVPPPGVERLVYVMDGDSDPRDTRAKLEAGLRRAMALRPGLRGQIARVPNGFDLNDVLLGLHKATASEENPR